ncbi:hypothetical protein Ga0466249_003077 [Sporomusaceae bacterium BoRhaA]|jgi:hypothetical protein|uniref:hypothetical protein n=1 Tax=Pelorhabdus rhamnosifermentans TaxID=2772457 RepID=UPI001C062EBD|nr:hypothetical protein [Pelorhabdus rhamnosifermentans]MBU2701950.1 hypothetical protein [Pelorhabdus rhamnosifermentans]
MHELILLLILCLFFSLSLRLRIKVLRQSSELSQTQASPVSTALTDLVSTAGGIYLSLILLVSFLKVDVPEKLTCLAVSVDPLALISLIITLIQPFVFSIFYKD